MSEPGAEVEPDADGVLHLPVPEVRKDRRGAVFVVAKGYAAKSASIADAVDGGELVIRLDRERVLLGQVVSAGTGDPIAGARVWAVEIRGTRSRSGEPPGHAVKTDDKGSFRVGQLGPGKHALQVYHSAWRVPTAMEFEVGDSNPGEVVVRLQQTHALSASIENLPPGVGYRLRLREKRGPRSGYIYEPPGGLFPVVVPRSGKVKVTGLAPGTYTGELTRPAVVPGGGEVHTELGTLKIGDHDAVVTWRADGMATGKLRGRLSIPVPFPQLLIEAYAESGRRAVASSSVDPGGLFEFELMPGRFRLRIVDLASGFVLGDSGLLNVEAGKITRQDLLASAGRLVVELVPRGPRPIVTHLTLQSDSGAKGEVRVPHEEHTLELYVPPGLIMITAESRELGRISTYGGSKPVRLGAGEVRVAEGTRVELEVSLRGPPTIEEIEGRR